MIQKTDHYDQRNECHRHTTRLYSFIILFSIALLLIQPVSGFVTLEYFHQADCVNCARTDLVIQSIRERYLDRVSIKDINIDSRETVRLLMSYGRTEIPVIVINQVKIIDGPDITEDRLDEEIRLAEAGAYTVIDSEKGSLISSGYLAVIFSYFLGIMTGISPCLLGSLVVMIAAATHTSGSQTASRFYATVFGAGLVTAYLFVTAGVLFAGTRFSSGAGFSTTIYAITALLTICFGIIQLGLIRLPVLAESRITRLFYRFNNLRGAFFLGIVSAVILAPCAGAPFLVLIETLLFTGSAPAFGMVLSFTSGVMTPFLIISTISGSYPQERMIRYSSVVQKASGILLIISGIWLLMEI